MTEHTPGPWRIHDMESDAIVAQGPNGGAEVANVANSCWRQNLRADAVLIASAPELLAAVLQYRDDMRHPNIAPDSRARRLEMIENIIAKATDQ